MSDVATKALCVVCKWRPAVVKGRCRACYQYRRNHRGKDRPEEIVIRHAERLLENRQAGEIYLAPGAIRFWYGMPAQKQKNGR